MYGSSYGSSYNGIGYSYLGFQNPLLARQPVGKGSACEKIYYSAEVE